MPTKARRSAASSLSALLASLAVGWAWFGAPRQVYAEAATVASSRPPSIVGLTPSPDADGKYHARVGRPFQLVVEVTDADGDQLRFEGQGLPPAARFDAQTGILTWTPTDADVGPHGLRLLVSDGTAVDNRTVQIEVLVNNPPSIRRSRLDFVATQGSMVPLDASDPENDPLSCSSPDLPFGATLHPNCTGISWTPEESDAGSRPVNIVASDGSQQTQTVVWLEFARGVPIEEEWESYFLPGLGWSLYAPRAQDSLGVLQGPVIEVVLASWIHRNENRGPSHGRVVGYMELFDSTRSETPVTLGYGLGFTLSLERNPQRRWLVPFYGLDFGGLRQDGVAPRLHWTPQAGLHIWSSQNLFLDARAGYRLVPGSLEEWSGFNTGVTADVTVW